MIDMKEEIKEILDKLKYTAKKHTIQILENGGKIERCPQEIETELRLNTYSAKILLDYITNLQEERDMFKTSFETMSKNYFEEKSKIDNAIKYIGNGNLGIPRKTRDKFIKILKGSE